MVMMVKVRAIRQRLVLALRWNDFLTDYDEGASDYSERYTWHINELDFLSRGDWIKRQMGRSEATLINSIT